MAGAGAVTLSWRTSEAWGFSADVGWVEDEEEAEAEESFLA